MTLFKEEAIGYWISLLFRCSQTYVARELTPFELGRGQHNFLLVLFAQDGISQDNLARVLRIDKATVARGLVKLERAGYVQRRREDADHRIKLVYLTEKARGIEATLASVLSTWNDVLMQSLSDLERHEVLTLLQRMTQNVSRAVE